MKGIERVKGAQSKPNPSPNAYPKLCDAHVREGDAHGFLFERKILVKSPEPENKAQRKVKLWAEITRKNDYRKLWVKIVRENYPRKLSPSMIRRRKVEIYRDTGVTKRNRKDAKSVPEKLDLICEKYLPYED